MFLKGVWRGVGSIIDKNKKYTDETIITQLRENLYSFVQRTKHGETGIPMHQEQGYLRLFPELSDTNSGRAELIVSHPFGVSEIEEGFYNQNSIKLETTQIIRSSTAKEPFTTKLIREYQISDGKLQYKIQMATNTKEIYDHLEGILDKIE